ncbi:hypothetical protein PCANC_23897 [Puccinia coronata f. sp. avenae]|uniref:Uncharacterized protein n=1 Tax=Puccinia coronata f. sp. avenae TaxID=200324 RepID=A0A2N5U083_9BASI|nr:hypothetical protein PCANC_23897 [Puccinia coronata f. sp. avenae]
MHKFTDKLLGPGSEGQDGNGGEAGDNISQQISDGAGQWAVGAEGTIIISPRNERRFTLPNIHSLGPKIIQIIAQRQQQYPAVTLINTTHIRAVLARNQLWKPVLPHAVDTRKKREKPKLSKNPRRRKLKQCNAQKRPNTHNALIIFSSCYLGRFPMVSRWLQKREQCSIQLGAIFSSTSPSSVTNSSASLRPAATLPALPSSTSSNPTQAIRSSHPPTRPSQHSSEGVQPNTAISRPGSPGSSRGSPNGTSPTSSHLFLLISSPSRRGSGIAALTCDIDSSNPEASRPGVRISTQNRANRSGLQLNKNNNGALHWAQIGSTHVMKKEEGGGG